MRNPLKRAILLTLLGMGLAGAFVNVYFPLLAHSDTPDGRKVIYLFSQDFPPDPILQYPSPPIKEARFWKLMDLEMKATPDLSLTNDMQQADYRVELRCTGVLYCSNLAVDIKDMNRNELGSFKIKKTAPWLGLKPIPLERIARELTLMLDERIKHFPEGDYGAQP